MMNYDEFKDYVVDHIKEYMPEEYQDREVGLHKVGKINEDELDGLTIRNPDNPITPNLYLNGFYEKYAFGQDEMSSRDILSEKNGMDLLHEDIQTNMGLMPVSDYLEIEADKAGYDSYEKMLEAGDVLSGYEDITLDVLRLDYAMRDIANIYMGHEQVNFNIGDVTWVQDYNQAKDFILPRLINSEVNEQLLSGRPHTEMADLSTSYCIQVGRDANGLMTVPLDKAMAEQYGVDLEELHKVAIENLKRIDPPRCKPMSQVIRTILAKNYGQDMGMSREELDNYLEEMVPSQEEEIMYVLSTESGLNGAAAVLDADVMDQVHEMLGEVYVLPSSTHELIIVPQAIGQDLAQLKEMVGEVNSTVLEAKDFLSDNIYEYDYQTKELRIAGRTQNQSCSQTNEANYEEAVDNILDTMYQNEQQEAMLDGEELCE